jgi:hypothetical protein
MASSAVGDRAALVEVLVVIDALHELAKPEQGTVVATALVDLVAAAEPAAPRLVLDLELAIAVGVAVRRFEVLDPRAAREDGAVRVETWDVLAWAAMEQAGEAPERHVPWIAYGVLVGYYVSRLGRPAITAVRDELARWVATRGTVTHSVRWEGRLLADFGVDRDGRMFAHSYLPLRPAGAERLHDELLFDTAWDEFADGLGRGRPNGTPVLRSLFALTWAPPIASTR